MSVIKKLFSKMRANSGPELGLQNTVVTKEKRPTGISVTIVRGFIQNEQSNVLVNSISKSKELNYGAITRALLKKAGRELQKAVDVVPGMPQSGDVLATAAYGLESNKVFHVVLPDFYVEDAGDILEKAVLQCLTMANNESFRSISFPALGTGGHVYPAFVSAHRMMEAVRRFEAEVQTHHVSDIRFICSESRNVNAFRTAIHEMPSAYQRPLVQKMKDLQKTSTKKGGKTMFRPSSILRDKKHTPSPLTKESRSSTGKTHLFKIGKALGKNKTYRAEQLLTKIRSHYTSSNESLVTTSFIPWRWVLTQSRSSTSGKDVSLLLDQIFSDSRRSPILIHGITSVGKSRLLHLITRKWATGDLKNVRLVVVVSFRLLLEMDDTSLTLQNCVLHSLQTLGVDRDRVDELMHYCNGKILVCIDDLEAWTQRFAQDLVQDHFFSRAQVLVTARTSSACFSAKNYNPKVTVELKGFTAEQVLSFLNVHEENGSLKRAQHSLPESVVKTLTKESSLAVTQAPGWLELIQHYALKTSKDIEKEMERLTKFYPLLNLSVTSLFVSDEWNFLEFAIKMGEEFLLLHLQQRSKVSTDWKSLLGVIQDHPMTCRSMVDYCMGVYMASRVSYGEGVPEITSMETLYLLQMSLTIACGRSAATAEYIQLLTDRLALDDPDVRWAREHALDTDSHSARVLKRLHDLQVACLRESGALPTGGPDVPAELEYLGAEYARVYRRACEEGTQTVHRTRVMLVGHFGAGKTSLKRRLVNEEFDPDYHITNGIEADPSACTIHVDHTHNWSLIKKALRDVTTDEHSSEVAKVLFRYLQKLSSSQLPISDVYDETNTTDTEEDASVSSDVASDSGTEGQGTPEPVLDTIDGKNSDAESGSTGFLDISGSHNNSFTSSNGSLAQRSTSMNLLVQAMGEAGLQDAEEIVQSLPLKVIEEFKKLVLNKDCPPESTGDGSEVKLSFWDFAGQQVFYTTHQTFLSHRAIYLLVLDITKDLKHPIKTLRQGRHGKRVDKACPQDVGQYLDYWLNCIHTHAVKSDQGCPPVHPVQPPVIIVCTHKDALEKDCQKNQACKEYFHDVYRHIEGKAYADHVYQKFFAVSNAEENDKEINRLQQAIVQLAQKQHYWGESIPLKWLALRTKLREVHACEGSVMSVVAISELANEVGITKEDEVKTFLLFYHALGEIIFFDDVALKEFVILDPQWLMDNFRKVITISEFHKQEQFENSRIHWANLDDYGILHDVILDNVWEPSLKHQLVCIMQKFDLLLPVPENYDFGDDIQIPGYKKGGVKRPLYFVPCLLPQASEEDIPPVGPADPGPLQIVFKDGFVSVGVFHRVLASCINDLKWLCFSNICHDFATFLPDEESPVSISLRCLADSIEIAARVLEEEVQGESSANPETTWQEGTSILPQVLQGLLGRVTVITQSVSPSNEFDIAVRCRCRGTQQKGAVIKVGCNGERIVGKKLIKCARHYSAFNAKQFHPWFTEPQTRSAQNRPTPTNPTPPKEVPTEDQLSDLASELGFEWELLAIKLGQTYSQIQQCKMENQYSAHGCIFSMLCRWRMRAKPGHVLDILTGALIQSARVDLAEKVARWRFAGKDPSVDQSGR